MISLAGHKRSKVDSIGGTGHRGKTHFSRLAVSVIGYPKMVRVTRFSPADPDVEKAIKELNDLLVDSTINKKAFMSQNDNQAIRNISIVERTERQQTESVETMATAADALGSIAIDATHLTMSVTDPTAWATAMNNLGMVPVGLAGQQLVSDSICVPGFDPSLSMMTGITQINPMMAGMGLLPPPPTQLPIVKEIIHCKSCTLFPPNPNLPPPSTRERPPGCKTVFVGGLPENATEEIIQELFEQCGDITAIRKSKKNFCHIRFAEEFMVDKAIYLSGYRMRLGSSTDKKDSGRLHVDFAQARDDFYEWECKQRMLAREERHRRKLEVDKLRPPSPPAIMHYSEHEATMLAEKLKALAAQAYALKEENDSLRWQLDAYRNEVDLLKQEKGHHGRTEESLTKDQQLQFLQQTMQTMQQQLAAMQEELNNKKSELEKAKEEQTHAHALVSVLKEQLKSAKEVTDVTNQEYLSKETSTVSVAVYNHDKEKDAEKQRQSLKSEKEALLIGIISTFLNVHPFGANTEYLWSYLQQLDSTISANEIETLLTKLPRMFKQEFTGVGATLEKRWKFCAFEGIKTT
uniref:Ecto-NOX disulfide-thiol exchanger 1 n=1 Tax=Xenopus tropicalis TaxID=8364 RepID=A0A803JVM9_XENTR